MKIKKDFVEVSLYTLPDIMTSIQSWRVMEPQLAPRKNLYGVTVEMPRFARVGFILSHDYCNNTWSSPHMDQVHAFVDTYIMLKMDDNVWKFETMFWVFFLLNLFVRIHLVCHFCEYINVLWNTWAILWYFCCFFLTGFRKRCMSDNVKLTFYSLI